MAKKQSINKVPDKSSPWSIGKFLKSFIYAGQGIREVFRNNRNLTVQAVIATVIIVLSILLSLSPIEMAVIIFTSFFVLILESVNTAVEKLIDVLSPGYHKEYGIIKDILAGAVLMASIMAVIIGLVIIGPKLLRFLK
jgi:diacylglycerol kinase (ATP)